MGPNLIADGKENCIYSVIVMYHAYGMNILKVGPDNSLQINMFISFPDDNQW